MDNTNLIALVADALSIELEHLGEQIFSFAPLSDREIATIAKHEMGAIRVFDLSAEDVETVEDVAVDPALHAMYRWVVGLDFVEPLPDLDEMLMLADASVA